MAKTLKIEERTEDFIREFGALKQQKKLPSHAILAGELGMPTKSTISEILGRRQNIQPESWNKFKSKYLTKTPSKSNGRTDISESEVQDFDGSRYKDKYLALLENQLKHSQEKIESRLQEFQASLTSISGNIIAGRADVRASIHYQVMKDSKGDEKKRAILMEQINKLIHQQFAEGKTDGMSVEFHS